MQKKLYLLLTILCIIFASIVSYKYGNQKKESLSETAWTEVFHNSLYIIKTSFTSEVPIAKLWQGAIQGVIKALHDPYSRFLTKEQYKFFIEDTDNRFGGIGIEASLDNNALIIISPIENSPAMLAGLKPYDQIIKVDDISVSSLSLEQAMQTIRGEPNTFVKLTILRPNPKSQFNVTIKREVIQIQVIESFMIDPSIGYIKIKQFTHNCSKEFKEHLKHLLNKHIKSLIIDLRWNPGGLLSEAVQVSDFFINQGDIVSVKGRVKDLNKAFHASSKNTIIPSDMPIVILMNEGSASASEILIAALEYHNNAITIGHNTFGKGSVQKVFPLPYEQALVLTVQKYYTPTNKSLHKVGLKPQISSIPKELSKTDIKNLDIIKNKNLLPKFINTHPTFSLNSIKELVKQSTNKWKLPLSEYASYITLKNYKQTKKTITIDLTFDKVLKTGVEYLKNILNKRK